MRVTKIEVQGEANDLRLGIIGRIDGSSHIKVTLLTQSEPDGRVHEVQADCREDVASMASCMQAVLDGYSGTNGDRYGYYAALEYFMD